MNIKELFRGASGEKAVVINGWIRNIRPGKAFGFIELNDGSCLKNVQVVFEREKLSDYDEISKLNIGASIRVSGNVVLTPELKQPFELHAEDIEILGESAPDYPLQNKRHSFEYLRTMCYLRPRTNTFSAVFRMRSEIAFALHSFFHDNGFVYVHTPLITASDAEGAGEMFKVTTLDKFNDKSDFENDFFGKPVNLTVSGQLEGEAFATAFGKIYTFGPTFRAENSNTPRHAAEFWMIEPEIAFADLNDDMELAEAMLKYVINHCMKTCPDELEFFNSRIDNGLLSRLSNIAENDFGKITYTDAVELLKKHNDKFEYKVSWGCDLQTEHERYLTENVFKKPVFVTDYPKEIKAFYMRRNDDGKTVAAADLLVPGIGEIIGGSQREERYDVLREIMTENKMDLSSYNWYLNLRKYGSVKHAGFGLGFERAVMYLTGMQNIRDVLPFPRAGKNAY